MNLPAEVWGAIAVSITSIGGGLGYWLRNKQQKAKTEKEEKATCENKSNGNDNGKIPCGLHSTITKSIEKHAMQIGEITGELKLLTEQVRESNSIIRKMEKEFTKILEVHNEVMWKQDAIMEAFKIDKQYHCNVKLM